jgi:hypothetical protein
VCALSIWFFGHRLVCQRLVKVGHVGSADQSFVVRVQGSNEVSLFESEVEQHQQQAHYQDPVPVHPSHSLANDHVATADWTDEASKRKTEDVGTQFTTTLMSEVDV